MKKFNILANQQRICGRIMPTNAIYGALTLKYTRKVPLEKYRVTDKNGHLVFNADGTEKTAWKTRRENCAEKIVYSIETTKMYRDNMGVSHFIVQLGRKNKNGDIIWHEHVLGDCALTRELEKFLTVKIVASGLWSQWDKYEIAEVKLSERRAIHNIVPKRKNAQNDYLYKGQFGYAVNPNIINENVKARTPIVHGNMDKLHPIDERPIVRVKTHSYDDSKVVHPENDGYIRHENGDITTRNGDKVEVAIKTKPCHESKPKIVSTKTRKPARAGYHYAG